MDVAVLARVTEPFFTTKEHGKGTGLGLAMAKGFAEQSGGALQIESTLGQGTVVSLWLPVAEEGRTATITDADHPNVPVRPTGARILLVDDDDAVRETLNHMLEDAGYSVLAAASGADALATLEADTNVDLLLSDLTMPRMNGVTLIQEAHQRRPGLPAILLTGLADDPAGLAAKGAIRGSYSLLRKPINSRALMSRIETMLADADAEADIVRYSTV
jgi:CheY-like chemotaxis protein